ncbi:hypothetical protein WN48_01636 [Eufriesea mexicana]|nr:hypothetical protein WN48_01636 [Eufriesea mexicana]
MRKKRLGRSRDTTGFNDRRDRYGFFSATTPRSPRVINSRAESKNVGAGKTGHYAGRRS